MYFWVIGTLIGNAFVLKTVVTIMLMAADFWTVKNMTGWPLVGLRWWNDAGEEGEGNTWRFESLEEVLWLPRVEGGGGFGCCAGSADGCGEGEEGGCWGCWWSPWGLCGSSVGGGGYVGRIVVVECGWSGWTCVGSVGSG